MGRKPNVYSRVKEAEDIVKAICDKYPDVMWAVRSDTIAVLGIENKERGKSNNALATIKPIRGVEKAIFQDNNIPIRYVIQIYYSDYNEWTNKKKQWILFHELLHVHPEFEATIKHDTEDFAILLTAAGVIKWVDKVDELPDLLTGDVKFDLSLRPSIEKDEDSEKDELDNVLDDIKKEEKEKE